MKLRPAYGLPVAAGRRQVQRPKPKRGVGWTRRRLVRRAYVLMLRWAAVAGLSAGAAALIILTEVAGGGLASLDYGAPLTPDVERMTLPPTSW
jgi:hypothetical protein